MRVEFYTRGIHDDLEDLERVVNQALSDYIDEEVKDVRLCTTWDSGAETYTDTAIIVIKDNKD